jgi:hypothetical protein
MKNSIFDKYRYSEILDVLLVFGNCCGGLLGTGKLGRGMGLACGCDERLL